MMQRSMAFALAICVLSPTLAGCGSKSNDSAASGGGGGTMATQPAPMNAPAPKPGLSGKQKLVLLAGAALLYYIYKKDQANNANAAAGGANGGKPQLYREEKGPNAGAIYYHKNDPQHTVVWLTAPGQGVQVPADQVQQYAPDYSKYSSQTPTLPSGAQTQPATQYDPSVAGGPPGPGQ